MMEGMLINRAWAVNGRCELRRSGAVADGTLRLYDGVNIIGDIDGDGGAVTFDAIDFYAAKHVAAHGRSPSSIELGRMDFDRLVAARYAMRRVDSEVGEVKAAIIKRGLDDATDDQLRAECERRFGTGGHNLDNLLRERNEYKRSADGWMADAKRAEEERDEWKRRAEAAEGDLKVALANNEAIAQTHLAWLETGSPYARERGPGIAGQRPDNSIAHLPEDLLADDAP